MRIFTLLHPNFLCPACVNIFFVLKKKFILKPGTFSFQTYFTYLLNFPIPVFIVFLLFSECRTGEVRVTQGHELPARYIIHTVGPKYNIKYQSAAENTLHACYRNVMQKTCEMGLHSLALCVINSVKRNYPPDEGAHIALSKSFKIIHSSMNIL